MQAGIVVESLLTKEGELIDAKHAHIPHYYTSEGVIKKATETNYLIPFIAVAHYPSGPALGNNDFAVVLDHVMDLGNIGTIIRTAQSFGINTFVTISPMSDPYQRKIIDASRGMIFKTALHDMQTPEDALSFLKEQGYQIIVTSPHAPNLQSQAPLQKKPIVLVVGNEQHGVSTAFMDSADMCIQIPMMPSVESLNVGVATGISLYELQFKLVLLMLREKIVVNIGRQINVTGKLIRAAFDKKISAVSGLSGMQVVLLMVMLCDKQMTRAQISRDVSLSEDELDGFLQPLLERGLIHAQANDYGIAFKGEQFLAEVWPVVEQTQEMILEGINADDRVLLYRMLERMQNNCISLLR